MESGGLKTEQQAGLQSMVLLNLSTMQCQRLNTLNNCFASARIKLSGDIIICRIFCRTARTMFSGTSIRLLIHTQTANLHGLHLGGVAKCFDYPFRGAVGAEPDRIHPTQKPVALYKWILSKYANPGDKILDTHLGSGSSRIAAYDLGFDFVGYEIDKFYFDKQEERFAKHTAQTSLFVGGE